MTDADVDAERVPGSMDASRHRDPHTGVRAGVADHLRSKTIGLEADAIVDLNRDYITHNTRDHLDIICDRVREEIDVRGWTSLALADLGLIDEYEFVVQPILAGHGPTLFAGLSERLELRLVGRQEFRSGAVALRYQPSRVTA